MELTMGKYNLVIARLDNELFRYPGGHFYL